MAAASLTKAADEPAGRVNELRSLYVFTDRTYAARSLDDVYAAALDAITETLGCERASILLFDRQGVMRFVAWQGLSDRYRDRLSGHTPWSPDDIDPDPIFVPDIADTDEADWVKAEIGREGIVALGFIPLTVRGRVIGKFMTYYGRRREFSAHETDLAVIISRQLSFSIDRTRAEAERHTALEELRLSEQRFRNMSENAPVMIWMSGPTGACEHLNRMLREFWGVPDDAVTGFDWRHTLHPDDVQHITDGMQQAIAEARGVTLKGRYRGPGTGWHWLQTDAQPRYAGDGTFLGMIGVNVDITRQEEVSAQRETMLAELNHRVKNTLAVVQAIAHRTLAEQADSPAVMAFMGRIAALARAHNMLTRSNWESTPLMQLARDTLQAGNADQSRFAVGGPDIVLTPKQTLAIALALHELHTNALKHGSLSTDAGSVDLSWQLASRPGAPVLTIVWREAGGPPVRPPARTGFGTVLIERVLAADLDGTVTLDYSPEGLVCTIEAPVARPGVMQ